MDSLPHSSPSFYKAAIVFLSRPRQDFTNVSTHFAARFNDEVSLIWTLIDPLGNRHTVQYIKSFQNPAIGAGWVQLRLFYGLVGVNWCLLKFKGGSTFDLFIYNNNGKEIGYQRSPLTVGETNQIPVLVPIVANLTTWKYYPCFCTIKLTPYQASSSQLYLPQHISFYLRDSGEFRWILKGPSGIQVDCFILAPPWRKDAKIGRGWSVFRTQHGFQPGQVLSLLFSTEDIRIVDVIIHTEEM